MREIGTKYLYKTGTYGLLKVVFKKLRASRSGRRGLSAGAGHTPAGRERRFWSGWRAAQAAQAEGAKKPALHGRRAKEQAGARAKSAGKMPYCLKLTVFKTYLQWVASALPV